MLEIFTWATLECQNFACGCSLVLHFILFKLSFFHMEANYQPVVACSVAIWAVQSCFRILVINLRLVADIQPLGSGFDL